MDPLGRKLGLDRKCRGLFFPENGYGELSPSADTVSRKKAVVRPAVFVGRIGRPPFSRNGSAGTEGELAAHQHHLHCQFDAQRLPSKKTARMGDKAKPLASAGRRLCCLNFSLSVLAVTSRKIEPRSDGPVSEMQKAGDRPPYGQNTQTSASTPQGRGFLFSWWKIQHARGGVFGKITVIRSRQRPPRQSERRIKAARQPLQCPWGEMNAET